MTRMTYEELERMYDGPIPRHLIERLQRERWLEDAAEMIRLRRSHTRLAIATLREVMARRAADAATVTPDEAFDHEARALMIVRSAWSRYREAQELHRRLLTNRSPEMIHG